MGKNLKGKEIGKGICQRQDGLYTARFVSRSGKRIAKHFPTVPEARNWLDDAKYADSHEEIFVPTGTTVDEWYHVWVENIICDLAPNTIRIYCDRYVQNIQPLLGRLKLSDVKPLHCKMVLNRMEKEDYAGSTIRQTYITMGTMFRAALMNDMIAKHPMDGVKYTKPIRAVDDIQFLTVDEQKEFLEVARDSHNYWQYALMLETGLRPGELIALTWDVIDWEKRTLTVNKTLDYRYREKRWRAGPPKTISSYRTIPLTTTAYDILKEIAATIGKRKEAEMLSQTLEYEDRRTGQTATLVMRDLVFINFRTGEPTKNSSYDTHMNKLCSKAGIPQFSMHDLRHTYATRAIERGVQPKALQVLLGHSSIKMTMDRYVHVSDESLFKAIHQFEAAAEP